MLITYLTRSRPRPIHVVLLAALCCPLLPGAVLSQTEIPPLEAVQPVVQQEVWGVMSGAGLKGTIEGWARVAGWTIVWDNPVDYRIRASATFHGGFEEAVARLVDAIHQGSPELTVTLYRGNRVLHVEDAARIRN
jgi:hypothetical protein